MSDLVSDLASEPGVSADAQSPDAVISLVAAVSENGVIGLDGAMPWRLSSDLQWFKRNTLGKPIVMGRKTFQSIGKALPGRTNIVITRDKNFPAEGVILCSDVQEALAYAMQVAKQDGVGEICVIGGGEIYAQTLSVASRLYLTRVMAKIDGDTVFPEINPDDWQVSRHGLVQPDAKNTHACEFFIFNRP